MINAPSDFSELVSLLARVRARRLAQGGIEHERAEDAVQTPNAAPEGAVAHLPRAS